MLFAELVTAFFLLGGFQAFQVANLSITKYLNSFPRKIDKKTGKRQTRPINGRLANLAIKTKRRSDEFHLQHFSVTGIKLANLNHRIFAALHSGLTKRKTGQPGLLTNLRRFVSNPG